MERKHYIDNLRWLCILLLIPFHCAMAYNSWGEGNYIVLGSDRILSSFLCALWPWFMPLLFLLAGLSARLSLTKRSKKQFIVERVLKLFIPFIFGTLFIAPILSYLADKINCGYDGNFFNHYVVFFTKWTDISGYDGGFTIAHFWFLLCLFIVSLIGCLVDLLLGKHIAKLNTEKTPLWVLILLVMLAFAAYPLQVAGKCLLTYLLLYLLGFYVFDKENNIVKLARFKWLFVGIYLILAALSVWLFIWSDYNLTALNLILTLLSGAFGVLAMLSLGYSYMNKANKITRFLSSISFPVYIIHFVWVVAFEYWFSLASSNTTFVFCLSILCSCLATLITSTAIKYCPVLNLAFGYKLKGRKRN
ncbi:MAG: acyltransferase [Anaeroplasmataceae bacterium]|nr:acyltransferase [Anaeroplasmataceae bacterium]